MASPELTLRARYIFPGDGAPIENGAVCISGERICYVGPLDRQPDLDLGNAAILPGLVNAHTHLELSNLRARDLARGNFAEWLRTVIENRRTATSGQIEHAVGRGIDESLAAGTTLLADISTGGQSWGLLARSPLRAVVFCELLGLTSERAAQTASSAQRWLERLGFEQEPSPASHAGLESDDGTVLEPLPWRQRPGFGRIVCGLSPHAPYSTHPMLYELAATWSRQAGCLLTTHLAETREELQLLEHRNGPLRGFLESIAAWNNQWRPAGSSPLDYLAAGHHCASARWLIAHANYLTDQEIAKLGSGGELASSVRGVVYCPHTHAFFGHRSHPYPKLLAQGVSVCLGSDGLASSPTLSILEAMRFLHARDPSLPGPMVIRMATLAGARALGLEEECGSLTPGKQADLAVVRLPDDERSDPYLLILESRAPVIRTMIGGRLVFQLKSQ